MEADIFLVKYIISSEMYMYCGITPVVMPNIFLFSLNLGKLNEKTRVIVVF